MKKKLADEIGEAYLRMIKRRTEITIRDDLREEDRDQERADYREALEDIADER